MFPLSKLHELSPKTRMRKVARILQGIEVDAASGKGPDMRYLGELVAALRSSPVPSVRAGGDAMADGPGAHRDALSGGPDAAIDALAAALSSADADAAVRAANGLRHALLRGLNAEPAEWDLVSGNTGLLDRSALVLRPFTVFLEDIRSPFNVGSLFRTAEAFGAERIILSPDTASPLHPRAEKTALGTTRALPWSVASLDSLRGEDGIFALEIGGTPIREFVFPARGTVLVGSEELGLSPEALSLADQARGRVSIPLAGAKRSLNVSVAFGILMQAWSSSAGR